MIKKALIVIITAVLFKTFLEWFFGKNELSNDLPVVEKPKIKIFNIEELKSNDRLYLSILGSVYDVTKGEKHYGKGGSYEFFVGRDASRAFVTGNFKDDLNDKIDDLSESQIGDIFNWKKFYDDSGYTFSGYLNGRFYNENGEKTDYLKDLEKVHESHKQTQKKMSEFNTRFPGCNSEWTQDKGLVKVWCTTESGGIKRSWSGYPRLVYNPNTKQEGCACVQESDTLNANIKLYPKCDQKSSICHPEK